LTSAGADVPFGLMRIIAGEFRGRKLLAPEGDVTRPITDRAKQSLFDVLAPLMADAVVYDCFAGTGSMGLECLSRGASHVTFFEADRSALARLHQNLAAVKAADRATVIPGNLFQWFAREASRPQVPPLRADLVFLDPPYRFLTQHPDELLQLALHLCHAHLKPDGLVIFRHDAKDQLALPHLRADDVRTYGEMMIELLRPEENDVTGSAGH